VLGNRWVVLTASVIANLCIGSAYAWSVFQKPLIDLFGWSTADASLAFTISFGSVPLAMIVAGKIQDRLGPRAVVLVGGVLFGVGIIAAGWVRTLGGLYATYGVTAGLGMGTVYTCTVANTVKLFPDRRGLAAGLVAAGFGSGAVLFAPLATRLIDLWGVQAAFKILGTGHLVLIPLLSVFIKRAPSGFVPPGWTPPAQARQVAAARDKNWRQLLQDPQFYLLWCIYALGTVSGLMIIAHASPFGQEAIKLSPRTAALAVGVLALANTSGRIFWGWISDRVGRFHTVIAMFVLGGLVMLTLPVVSGLAAFLAALVVVGLCFGGFMGIFPSITADAFGPKNLGMNYGVMFTAFGSAAFVGPRLAATVKEHYHGDYTYAFLIAAGLSLLGIVLTLVLVVTQAARRSSAVPPQDDAESSTAVAASSDYQHP